MSFTIGSDPELLLTDGTRLISAIGVIPGTKEEPADIGVGTIHPDNVTAEFNTLPASTKEEFDKNTLQALEAVTAIIAASNLSVSKDAVGLYHKDQLEHPDSKESGCQPDFCAYHGGGMNEAPPLEAIPFRSAGGHIHVGVKLKDDSEAHQLIRVLDLLIAIPSMKHESADRRSLYGKAGAFRIKPYGVEYRTPSNWWVFEKKHRDWVYDRVAHAVECFKDIIIPDTLQDIINEHDTDAACDLMAQYNLVPCPD